MRSRNVVDALTGDWREVRARAREKFGKRILGDGDSGSAGPAAIMARASAAMHDSRQAQADLAAYDAVTSDDLDKYREATMHIKANTEDWTGAITAIDEVLAGYDRLPDKGRDRAIVPTLKARALAHRQ